MVLVPLSLFLTQFQDLDHTLSLSSLQKPFLEGLPQILTFFPLTLLMGEGVEGVSEAHGGFPKFSDLTSKKNIPEPGFFLLLREP